MKDSHRDTEGKRENGTETVELSEGTEALQQRGKTGVRG